MIRRQPDAFYLLCLGPNHRPEDQFVSLLVQQQDRGDLRPHAGRDLGQDARQTLIQIQGRKDRTTCFVQHLQLFESLVCLGVEARVLESHGGIIGQRGQQRFIHFTEGSFANAVVHREHAQALAFGKDGHMEEALHQETSAHLDGLAFRQAGDTEGKAGAHHLARQGVADLQAHCFTFVLVYVFGCSQVELVTLIFQ